MPQRDKQKTRPEVMTLMAVLAYEYENRQAETPTNANIATYVEPFLLERFPRSERWFVPQLKTIGNMIGRMRPGWTTVADEPFSLGNARLHGIPDEALPDVLRAWAYCKITDTKFTARHARWVGQLRKVVVRLNGEPKSERELLGVARRYAAREVAEASTKKPGDPLGIDTSDLDARLAFGSSKITGTLTDLGRISRAPATESISKYESEDFKHLPPEEQKAIIEEATRGLTKTMIVLVYDLVTAGRGVEWDINSRYYMALAGRIREIFDSAEEDSSDIFKNPAGNIEYPLQLWATWASYFVSKGEKWTDLDLMDDSGIYESELSFFDLGLKLAEEIGEYRRGNPDAKPSFSAGFHPSDALYDLADVAMAHREP